MVEAVRRGAPLRAVARRFRVALATVRLWVGRAKGQRLDRCDWADRTPGARRPWNHTPAHTERTILAVRHALKHSVLGEWGARAIRAELERAGELQLPSVRTIGRVLARHGALDAKARARRPAPPRGWYLPAVAKGCAELDSFDVIEDLKIQNGPLVSVLTGIALHGGQSDAWPELAVTARCVVQLLLQRFAALGTPHYAQFDNDTIFQGAHQHPDSFGRVIRLCLALEITPVFAPPNEPGFQNLIEHFNGLWQAKVWQRFHFASVHHLKTHSARYITVHRERGASRAERAPPRRAMPHPFAVDLQAPLQGRVIYLRRADAHGAVQLLGHRLPVDRFWAHRLVRCEVDLTAEHIGCFGLRRRNPTEQPLLATFPYRPPKRRFRDRH